MRFNFVRGLREQTGKPAISAAGVQKPPYAPQARNELITYRLFAFDVVLGIRDECVGTLTPIILSNNLRMRAIGSRSAMFSIAKQISERQACHMVLLFLVPVHACTMSSPETRP
jgi:hypothetical protein